MMDLYAQLKELLLTKDLADIQADNVLWEKFQQDAKCKRLLEAYIELESLESDLPKHQATDGLLQQAQNVQAFAEKTKARSRLIISRSIAASLGFVVVMISTWAFIKPNFMQAPMNMVQSEMKLMPLAEQVAKALPDGLIAKTDNFSNRSRELKKQIQHIDELGAELDDDQLAWVDTSANDVKELLPLSQISPQYPRRAAISSESLDSIVVTGSRIKQMPPKLAMPKDKGLSWRKEHEEQDESYLGDVDKAHQSRQAKNVSEDLDRIEVTGSRISRTHEIAESERNFEFPEGFDEELKDIWSEFLAGDSAEIANGFLQDYQTLDNLSFERSIGYWSNTYIPGDVKLRAIGMQLNQWNRKGLPVAQLLAPEVKKYQQPLDQPMDSALDLHLHSDQQAVQGKTRLRLQVGINAAEQNNTARSSINMVVLVAMHANSSLAEQSKTRAFVDELLANKSANDQITLIMVGNDKPVIISATEFRYGTIATFWPSFINQLPQENLQEQLAQALKQASELVTKNQSNADAFGRNSLLMITDHQYAQTIANKNNNKKIVQDLKSELAQTIHHNALNGISFSVMMVSDQVGTSGLEQLSLVGLGRFHHMQDKSQAASIIYNELQAVNQIVAQALRLSIRLQPGVKLVDVLGAERLSDANKVRIKAIEKSVDQRLQQQLSIQADRGDDDNGIQILIPNFYAVDNHIILLDLVVDGPGSIADVSLRYKDLIHMRNGTHRKTFTLPTGENNPGLLELNVTRNILAYEIHTQLRAIAKLIADEDMESAVDKLSNLRALIVGMKPYLSKLDQSQELDLDIQMIDHFMSTTLSYASHKVFIDSTNSENFKYWLAQSMQFAAWNKIVRISYVN